MISEEESRHTFDFGDHYVITQNEERDGALFSYRSDTNVLRVTGSALAGLVA